VCVCVCVSVCVCVREGCIIGEYVLVPRTVLCSSCRKGEKGSNTSIVLQNGDTDVNFYKVCRWEGNVN